jgi:hypothetical protein
MPILSGATSFEGLMKGQPHLNHRAEWGIWLIERVYLFFFLLSVLDSAGQSGQSGQNEDLFGGFNLGIL